MFKTLITKVAAGRDHVLARVVSDLQSHRSVWNYIYMALYVFIALWLTIFYGRETGATVIISTAGVVTGIFTNVVWSKTYEKKNKEPDNEPKPTPGENGAAD